MQMSMADREGNDTNASLFEMDARFLDMDDEMEGGMQRLLCEGMDMSRTEVDGNQLMTQTTRTTSLDRDSRAANGQAAYMACSPFGNSVDPNACRRHPELDPKSDSAANRLMQSLSNRVLNGTGTPEFSNAPESPFGVPVMDSTIVAPKKKRGAPQKTQWKPTNDELRILDHHFNSRNTLSVPKLLKRLQTAGKPTYEQLDAWLKAGCAQMKSVKPKQEAPPPSQRCQTTKKKRPREEELELVFGQFGAVFDSIMNEMQSVLCSVREQEILSLCRAIRRARYVICYGVGNEGFVMQCFAQSLNQIGIEAFFLSDISLPQIAQDDIFLASAGPSFYCTVSALALEAKRLGAQVIAFTAHPSADMLFAKETIRIPAQTLTPAMPLFSLKKSLTFAETVSFLPDDDASIMNLGDSYCLSLRLTQETVIRMLKSKMSKDPN